MSDHILFVQTNAVEGREAEFNDWYDNRHVPDVLAVPGFTAAQRFELSPVQRAGRPAYPYRYVAIYEIDGDPVEALRQLGQARDAGMEISPAMERAASSHVFMPLGPRVERRA